MLVPDWFATLQGIFEILYFASGVAIAVAALLGLRQLTITREISSTNAKREALRFAAERCQYFAETAVPKLTQFVLIYQSLNLRFLSDPKVQFMIVNGEIVNHNFDLATLDREFPQIVVQLIDCVNAVEAFAIPFVAAVADDDLGFQETAIAFCQQAKMFMPAFFQLRRIGSGRFESAVRLYDLWNKRLVANALAPAMKGMEELLKSAKENRIKPIGTGDTTR